MAAFDVNEFVISPTLTQFDKCKKSDLREIAEYFCIPVSSSLSKAELKAVILDSLINKGIFSLPVSDEALGLAGVSSAKGGADSLEGKESENPVGLTPTVESGRAVQKPVTLPHFVPFSAESTPGSKLDARLKVRLARLQLEKEERDREFQLRKELEFKKLEAETAIKLRQLELQASSISTVASTVPPSGSAAAFDVSKNISLVPVFRESEVESYFGAFERIAAALHWPEDVWAILLQCKLTG